MTRFYEPPEDVGGTVFDPCSETFGPIMAALQAGDFEVAAATLAGLVRQYVLVTGAERFTVDLPNPLDLEGPWVEVATFESRSEAIAFAREFGADADGKIALVSELDEPDDDERDAGIALSEAENSDEQAANERFDTAMNHALDLLAAFPHVWSVSSQDDEAGTYEIEFEQGTVYARQDGAEWIAPGPSDAQDDAAVEDDARVVHLTDPPGVAVEAWVYVMEKP